jgi:hypothetical protein
VKEQLDYSTTGQIKFLPKHFHSKVLQFPFRLLNEKKCGGAVNFKKEFHPVRVGVHTLLNDVLRALQHVVNPTMSSRAAYKPLSIHASESPSDPHIYLPHRRNHHHYPHR